ncbi:MAG TPA: aminotransferase class I/II-fold pyridoxal phosphate-dependent enzyme [Solirubrobacteraceae bacterium]
MSPALAPTPPGSSDESASSSTGQIAGRTARQIAVSAEASIRDGSLAPGDPLPTVRSLASRLATSPATVSSAYRILRQRGLVVADGRRGTRVAPRPALRLARPGAVAPLDTATIDLSHGLSDPVLLPPLAPVLARIDAAALLAPTAQQAVDPRLRDLASRSFAADGVDSRAVTVVGGALDGIERVLESHLLPGDKVAIEDPAYPPLRDILLALGLAPVPVAVDDRGPIPAALAASLSKGITAVLIVPRAQNPFGSALDPERAADLSRALAGQPELMIVEDDYAAVVAGAPYVSVIPRDWPRWAVIRSVSKVLHPDLRLALLAGDETTVARVEGRQALGTRWVSRLLQMLAAEMLGDPAFEATAARASDTYAHRRRAMIAALGERGIAAHGRSGLNVWVSVREESPVVSALLGAGWLVAAGERFRIATSPGIRITTSTLAESEADDVARIIAAVEHGSATRSGY